MMEPQSEAFVRVKVLDASISHLLFAGHRPDQKTSAGDQGGFIDHRRGGKISQRRSDCLVESDLVVGRPRWNIPATQLVKCCTHHICGKDTALTGIEPCAQHRLICSTGVSQRHRASPPLYGRGMLRDGRGGLGGEAMSLCRRDILRGFGCFCGGGSSCAALFASSKSKSKDISGLVHHLEISKTRMQETCQPLR